MSDEMTTEVLAKSIDSAKKIVKNRENGNKISIQGLEEDYYLINKAASTKSSQLNAIAPLDDQGKPDYNNVAVVYAGTNSFGDEGKKGFETAGTAFAGGLSAEYQEA
ncbi:MULTISPECIES: hypothetical protein [Enterococcus]|uniref:hypothetical protein n=1 Tax=Enterococcus TaxID=1350 RepID=UPI003F29F11C